MSTANFKPTFSRDSSLNTLSKDLEAERQKAFEEAKKKAEEAARKAQEAAEKQQKEALQKEADKLKKEQEELSKSFTHEENFKEAQRGLRESLIKNTSIPSKEKKLLEEGKLAHKNYQDLEKKAQDNPKDKKIQDEFAKFKQKIAENQKLKEAELKTYNLRMTDTGEVLPMNVTNSTLLGNKDIQSKLSKLKKVAAQERAQDIALINKFRKGEITPSKISEVLEGQTKESREAFLVEFSNHIPSEDKEKYAREVYQPNGLALILSPESKGIDLSKSKITDKTPAQREAEFKKDVTKKQSNIENLKDKEKKLEEKYNKIDKKDKVEKDKALKELNIKKKERIKAENELKQKLSHKEGKEFIKNLRANNSTLPEDQLQQRITKAIDEKTNPIEKKSFTEGVIQQVKEDKKFGVNFLGSDQNIYSAIDEKTELTVDTNGTVDATKYSKKYNDSFKNLDQGEKQNIQLKKDLEGIDNTKKDQKDKLEAKNKAFEDSLGTALNGKDPNSAKGIIKGLVGPFEDDRKDLAKSIGWSKDGTNSIPKYNEALAKHGYQVRTNKYGETVVYGDGKKDTFNSANTQGFKDIFNINNEASISNLSPIAKKEYALATKSKMKENHGEQIKQISTLQDRNIELDKNITNKTKEFKRAKTQYEKQNTNLKKLETDKEATEKNISEEVKKIRTDRLTKFDNSSDASKATSLADAFRKGGTYKDSNGKDVTLEPVTKDNFRDRITKLKHQLDNGKTNGKPYSPEFKQRVIEQYYTDTTQFLRLNGHDAVDTLQDIKSDDPDSAYSLRKHARETLLKPNGMRFKDINSWEVEGNPKGLDRKSIIANNPKVFDPLTKKSKDLETQIESQNTKVEDLKIEKNNLESSLNSMNLEREKNKKDIVELQKFSKHTDKLISQIDQQVKANDFKGAALTGLRYNNESKLSSYFQGDVNTKPTSFEKFNYQLRHNKDQDTLTQLRKDQADGKVPMDTLDEKEARGLANTLPVNEDGINSVTKKLQRLSARDGQLFLANFLRSDGKWAEALNKNKGFREDFNKAIGKYGYQAHPVNPSDPDDTRMEISGDGKSVYDAGNTRDFTTTSLTNTSNSETSASFADTMKLIGDILGLVGEGVNIGAQAYNHFKPTQSISQMHAHQNTGGKSIYYYAQLGAKREAELGMLDQYGHDPQIQELYGKK